jgi:hypothetical protein
MALFNLTDIAYKKEEGRFFFSFSGFSGGRNNYNPNLMRYPSDLGNTDKGHYMLIHVNAQDKTAYPINAAPDPRSQIQKNREGLRARTGAVNIGGGAKTIIDSLKSLAGGLSAPTGPIEGSSDTEMSLIGYGSTGGFLQAAQTTFNKTIGTLDDAKFLRTTTRTMDTIALYMPDTLAFTDNQRYSSLELGAENAAKAAAGVSILSDSITGKEFDPSKLGKNATPFLGAIAAKLSSGILGASSATALFASAFGLVKNPQLELLYTSPDFRQFAFEFMFYPRSEKEANEVQSIIQRLRFHQAPEILSGSGGYFMVPPSEFDIEFHYNGEVNPNIPAISTCALTSISVDYAPNGFRAYEVPGENKPILGSTGMPVGIRVNLTFQELEIMTKFNYENKTNRGKV